VGRGDVVAVLFDLPDRQMPQGGAPPLVDFVVGGGGTVGVVEFRVNV